MVDLTMSTFSDAAFHSAFKRHYNMVVRNHFFLKVGNYEFVHNWWSAEYGKGFFRVERYLGNKGCYHADIAGPKLVFRAPVNG